MLGRVLVPLYRVSGGFSPQNVGDLLKVDRVLGRREAPTKKRGCSNGILSYGEGYLVKSVKRIELPFCKYVSSDTIVG